MRCGFHSEIYVAIPGRHLGEYTPVASIPPVILPIQPCLNLHAWYREADGKAIERNEIH
jgi:hypothetical protein